MNKTELQNDNATISNKVDELLETSSRIQELKSHMSYLEEQISLGIIDGLSSGEDLFDFAMLATGGVYDQTIFNTQYQDLINLTAENAGERIMIYQEGTCVVDKTEYLLFDIYLARIRKDNLKFDKDNLLVSIPVEPGYLQFKQTIQDNVFYSRNVICSTDWIEVGPLENIYSPTQKAEYSKGTNMHFVGQTSPFCIELLPCEHLHEDYSIDDLSMKALESLWTRSKMSIVK